MEAKRRIIKEIKSMKKELRHISEKKVDEKKMVDSYEASRTTSNMFELLKYMIDENRKTTMILKQMSESLGRMEEVMDEGEVDENVRQGGQYQDYGVGAREVPISNLDAKILQILQMNGMCCADDVKKRMDYKGRNAASARLNKLYKLGLIDRHQLGHKVYYKFDVGKAANTLIVSPPQ